ncbi:hypothetical protein KDK_73560 [Dictyobacter kobayashii]|uniref:Uncharacterized protein n=2 Tax=Dictyobacter kobayashii TaxID=2014872 RepID=A0A402AWU9_9CHLR|nr:hypothetical protein KDK_73560 [Dictyobacter kobayashii]
MLYAALFAVESRTRQALEKSPERIMLIAADDDVDAIPWEYLYGPDGFLVQECQFVRGLPAEQRQPAPTMKAGLHIVAVPSNPLSDQVEPLAIDAEWMNLRESVQALPSALTLERVRPPTIRQLRNAVAGQRQRVVHFMGHGGQMDDGAVLCFEKENGDLDLVKSKEIAMRLRGTTFLVTLNACVTASPGDTMFSNLAATLVRQRIPYALGMRLSIYDKDARLFARAFYDELARGTPVEEALFQARLTLASETTHPWVVGVPVLYTSLTESAHGVEPQPGTPTVKDHQPPLDVNALPRAEGIFQGRVSDLRRLGTLLTGDKRPRIINIHGGGGQGKTALAREAVERFAWAWPDGIWSTTLEKLFDRAFFAAELARFLGINTQDIAHPNEIEHLLFNCLSTRRVLIVLDNAETLIEAIEANNVGAQHLAQLLQQLPSPSVSLLITSRIVLGWPSEIEHEIGGLTSEEGAQLFIQSSPQRREAMDTILANELSQRVEGHPLSLRLLGGAFNFSAIPLAAFVQHCEEQLINAENTYLGLEHRHRKLYACLETSIRYLTDELRNVLGSLWIFHAPFIPETVVAILDPETKETEDTPSKLRTHLHNLRLRGLLTTQRIATDNWILDFYYLLPTTRPYIEQQVQYPGNRQGLLLRFGRVYSMLLDFISNEMGRTSRGMTLVEKAEMDFERAMGYLKGTEQAQYKIRWASILHRLRTTPQRSLKLLEEALDELQGRDKEWVVQAFQIMGGIYNHIGEPERALQLFGQALPLIRETSDRASEAAILTSMANVYSNIGDPVQALQLLEQALLLTHKVGNRDSEAYILNNMANVYEDIGEPTRALQLYAQALSLMHEIGDRAGGATAIANIASIYATIGEPARALQLYEQALSLMREVGDRTVEAAALNNMASVYRHIGEPTRALQLYEQSLTLTRENSDRVGEVATLNNMASIYADIGKPTQALQLYEQILPITRKTGVHHGEAATLNNMALVYTKIGNPVRALQLYEQALPLRQEIGDRPGEAATLTNMASAYISIGESAHALQLYEQALPIRREVGDRAGEAVTLANMANVYITIGEPARALQLYEEALLLMRAISHHNGEAGILSSMALVYSNIGDHSSALQLLKQALPLMRAVGNRAGEATTLNTMASVYTNLDEPAHALQLYEQALPLRREVGDRPGEIITLINIAIVLYQVLEHKERAISTLQQALQILEQADLPQDIARQNHKQLSLLLQYMKSGMSLNKSHPSTKASPAKIIETLITATIAVMTTEPEQQPQYRKVLEDGLREIQLKGPEWQAEVELFNSLLMVLDGQMPVLPADHPYASVLTEIQAGIATDGRRENDDVSEGNDNITHFITNTVAVLGPKREHLPWWREMVVQMKFQASKQDMKEFVAFLDAVIKLLDAQGDPTGLGEQLAQGHAQVWQKIIQQLAINKE